MTSPEITGGGGEGGSRESVCVCVRVQRSIVSDLGVRVAPGSEEGEGEGGRLIDQPVRTNEEGPC